MAQPSSIASSCLLPSWTVCSPRVRRSSPRLFSPPRPAPCARWRCADRTRRCGLAGLAEAQLRGLYELLISHFGLDLWEQIHTSRCAAPQSARCATPEHGWSGRGLASRRHSSFSKKNAARIGEIVRSYIAVRSPLPRGATANHSQRPKAMARRNGISYPKRRVCSLHEHATAHVCQNKVDATLRRLHAREPSLYTLHWLAVGRRTAAPAAVGREHSLQRRTTAGGSALQWTEHCVSYPFGAVEVPHCENHELVRSKARTHAPAASADA